MKILRFCAKNSKYCDFLLFLIGIGSKTAIFTKILFVFLSPALCRQKWYRVFAKQKAKESEQTGKMCGINSHLFLFWKFVQRKEKFIFFEQFSWFLAKITFFETWNIFFESAFHIFQKQFAIHLAYHDETFSNANKEIFVFKQSNGGQICCFKPICSALLVFYRFQSANNFKNTIERSFLWFKVVFVLKTLTYNKEQQSGIEKQIFAFFEDF